MPELLLKCIEPVTRRFRQLRWWRLVTLIVIVAATVGLLVLGRLDGSAWAGPEAASLILIGTLSCVFAAWCYVRFSFHDTRAIAGQIESKFPNLQQRLLTALSQVPPEGQTTSASRPIEPLGYLQRRVIDETRDHARTHQWAETVPSAQLFRSRLSGLVATAALAAILAMLAVATPDPTESSLVARSRLTESIVIEPGDVSIERGTGLVVTARFSGAVPEQAELVCLDEAGAERRIGMARNLDDPVLGAYVAAIDRPFSYQVLTPLQTSSKFDVQVFEFPALVRADAELRYPEYTGLAERRIEDTVRVTAVEGSSLTWALILNKPVESAALISEDGERVELEASSNQPEVVTVTLPMHETRRWKLALSDDQGRANKLTTELIARVLPNQAPKLKLLAAGDVRVSPLEEFPLAAEVRDDFGIARVGLTYRFGDQPETELVLRESIPGGAVETVQHVVEFEALGAVPDQLLAYHFWAEDIGPDSQLRRTEGDLFFAEVRPFEEIFREGESPPGGQQQQQQQGEQSQNGQQAEELAELQKQIINATWNVKRREISSEPSPAFAADAQLIAESQREALGQLEELAEQLRDDESREHAKQVGRSMSAAAEALEMAVRDGSVDPLAAAMIAEQAAYQGLLKLRAREFQVMRQQQQQGGQANQSASRQQRQQQLEALELSNEENRYETQQQAQSSAQEQEQRETRQVLNRLRDLARRQEDLNQQVAQLQSALEQVDSEEQRQEIERQLKRLRDQQENLLREVDELAERMQTPENQERMAEAAEQLSQTRENVQQATEALGRNDASDALTAGTRAERELSELRDEFRQEAAGEYSEAVREMRRSAQELDEQQQRLSEQLESIDQSDQPGLRSGNDREQLREQIRQQRERLNQLLEEMKQTVEQAELSEPLLAQKLYETFRTTQQQQVDERLRATGELLRNGFDEEARQFESEARQGITELREGLEQAAEAVLGDETKALERALGELERLTQDLDDEIRRRGGSQDGDPGESETGDANRGDGQPSDGQPSDGQPSDGQPSDGRSSDGQPSDGRSGDGETRDGQPRDGQTPGDRAGEARRGDGEANDRRGDGQGSENETREAEGGASLGGEGEPSDAPSAPGTQSGQPGGSPGGEQSDPSGERSEDPSASPGSSGPGGRPASSPGPGGNRGGGGGQEQTGARAGDFGDRDGGDRGGIPESLSGDNRRDPLTGEGFREWSDRLRDVEEMVDDPEMRSQAARIRDRARELRREMRRHAKEPQWPLVEELIAKPLRELRRDVAEELMRRSAERNANVPIDRDPVPEQFSDAVRLYYERLGAGR